MNAEPWVWGLIGFVAGAIAVAALAWHRFTTSVTEQGPLSEREKKSKRMPKPPKPPEADK